MARCIGDDSSKLQVGGVELHGGDRSDAVTLELSSLAVREVNIKLH